MFYEVNKERAGHWLGALTGSLGGGALGCGLFWLLFIYIFIIYIYYIYTYIYISVCVIIDVDNVDSSDLRFCDYVYGCQDRVGFLPLL